MSGVDDLEKRVAEIEGRNRKVEEDKGWETSWTRRTVIFLLTYLALGIYMTVIGVNNSWLNAIIPSVGFLLSTLTLPFFKNVWSKYFRSKT